MPWDEASEKRLAQLYRWRKKAMTAANRCLRALVQETIASIEDKSLVRAELRSVRVKTLESVARKASRNRWDPDDALWRCSDLIGCRVVCNNVEDVYRFVELLREALPVIYGTVEVQDQIAKPNPSGYRAIHVNFGVDVGKNPFSPDMVPCEIQVRSRLQDAWAELSHGDIYKADNMPEDLPARLSDLARSLAAADGTASVIRERAMTVVIAPRRRPNLSSVTAKGIAHVFSRVFGRNPPDYLVRQAISLARALKVGALTQVSAILDDVGFRDQTAAAYAEIMPGRISSEETLLAAIRATAKGKQWAIAEVVRLARAAWDEIDQTARREALLSLPETIEEFIEEVEGFNGGGSILEWADALGTTSACLICGNTVVDAYALAEAAVHHYKADEGYIDRIEGAMLRSEVDTDGYGDGTLCAYHSEQAGKDD